MEQTGVMSEEAWSSLSDMYNSKEEADLLTQLLRGFSCPNELTYSLSLNGTLSDFLSKKHEDISYTRSFVSYSDPSDSTDCLVSQESGTFSPDDGQSTLFLGGTYLCPPNGPRLFCEASDIWESSRLGGRSPTDDSVDNLMQLHYDFNQPGGNNIVISDSFRGSLDQYDLSDSSRLEMETMDRHRQGDFPNASESKKRSRNVTYVSRSKKSLKSDKCQKVVSNNAGKNDDSNSIEEESNSEEVSRGKSHTTKTSKVSRVSGEKGKGSKGASSDPQSLYARKRRERINERLRILQSLVPNGTKVDISTMLEEAVHYVKFLQLQIKLLSSDDTWMYAPLAYNGMDIGISNFGTTTSPK